MKTRFLSGLCLFAGFVLCSAAPAPAQSSTISWTITGVVVDKAEQPVADAKVCAWGTAPMSGRLPCAQSNAAGQFAIKVQRADQYQVNAESFAQGYPPGWAFYGKLFSNGVSVTVAESSEEPAPVKITLGPKAGRLLMKLFEGQSNKIIEKGQLKLCRIGEPKSCWQIGTFFPNGQYEILTPEVPFTIQFETWEGEWVPKKAFDDAGMPVEGIQVDLGARKELTVRLG